MEAWLSWESFWAWLGRVADVVSLATLPVSVYAAWKVRYLGAKVAFNVRAPGALGRIDDLAVSIKEDLESGNANLEQIVHKIAQCKAEIETIQTGTTGGAAKAARELAAVYRQMELAREKGQSISGMLWMISSLITTFRIHARSLHDERQMGASK